MKVFSADIAECADYATLDDAPKALNRFGVHVTDDLSPLRMVNGDVRIGLASSW
jgi:hypothetical protein